MSKTTLVIKSAEVIKDGPAVMIQGGGVEQKARILWLGGQFARVANPANVWGEVDNLSVKVEIATEASIRGGYAAKNLDGTRGAPSDKYGAISHSLRVVEILPQTKGTK